MSAKEQKSKQTSKAENAPEEVEGKDLRNEELDKSTEETVGNIDDVLNEVDDMDDLLNEIDDVLEENAELFVSQYVQKGGQ